MFLSSISGGLIALGLIGTATHIGAAFYAIGLVLVPTLVFVGLVTFQRTMQSGVEDFGYARRIAQLRGFYFDIAPQLEPYLLDIPQPKRMRVQGLHKGMWQGFLAVSGMVAVVTAVLFGSAVGLGVAVASGHSLAAALIAGVPSGIAALVVLIWYQCHTWNRAIANEFMPD
jgi:hypothetical protein